MKHATSIALYDYWRSCHDRSSVTAGHIRAAELAPILPSLFLIDPDSAAGLRFRFCGASISTRYGRDLSEESFLALWNTDDGKALERHLTIVSRLSTGLVAGVMAETVGSGYTSLEMLLLPLAGATGMAGLIGSIERIGGHDDANRIRARFVAQTLRSIRFLPAAEHPLFRMPLPASAIPQSDRSAVRRRYGHLSVVSGGK